MIDALIKKQLNKAVKNIIEDDEASDDLKQIAEDIKEEIEADETDTARLTALTSELQKAKETVN